MKIGRFLLILIAVMGLFIVFGNRGLRDNYVMRENLMSLKKANQTLIHENAALLKTTQLLRDDMPYIEQVARNELGMVKKGDLVYRIGK
ncbi:MAG: septum formation initiator family protein [Syntrophales bacterium]|nr:septum formation initiator family protein [Syntrophales bacterium]